MTRGSSEQPAAWAAPRFDITKGNRQVKEILASRSMTLADLGRLAGVPYYVLLRAVLGYAKPSDRLREVTSHALGMEADQLWGSLDR